MAPNLSKLAAGVARRWRAADERRVKKSASPADLTIENMREFADGIYDGLDAGQLDTIADLAVSKIQNFRIGQGK